MTTFSTLVGPAWVVCEEDGYDQEHLLNDGNRPCTNPCTKVPTDQLKPGDRVFITHIVARLDPHNGWRTVREVTDSGYIGGKNEPILNVYYVEPSIPGVWSDGNSGTRSTTWTVAR